MFIHNFFKFLGHLHNLFFFLTILYKNHLNKKNSLHLKDMDDFC